MAEMTIFREKTGMCSSRSTEGTCRPRGGRIAESAGAPLTESIRQLGIGDAVRFPIERHGSVKAIVSRMRMEQLRIGWNASIKVDYDNYQVEVRRTR